MHLVLIFNIALFILRIIYVEYYPTDLSPEEAQYWDWSRELDWSYYSKPPMVAYLNFLSTHILGNTELGVRITPILLSFVLSITTYLFTKEIFDSRTALIASTLPQLSIGLSANSILMTTDAPFVFFWSLCVMTIYFAIQRNTTRLWFLVGTLAGLAFLSKYPAIFLLPITLLYLSLYRRQLLTSIKPYVSLIPPLVLSFPVLYWNYKHDFVSFKHVSNLASKGSGYFNLSYFFEFFGGQILLLSILPFFVLLYAWYKSLKDEKLIFFTFYSLPIVLFFLILSLKKEVYANWAGFAYFSAFILIAYTLSKRKVLSLLSYSVSFLLFILLHFTPIFDYLGLTKLLPPERDPNKVMVGWQKLGQEVSKLYTGKELILSPRYQISAELAFYVQGNPKTDCINLGRRMNQYDLWKHRVKDLLGNNAIYVDYGPLPDSILKASGGIIEFKQVKVDWRSKHIRTLYVYKIKKYKGMEENLPMGY